MNDGPSLPSEEAEPTSLELTSRVAEILFSREQIREAVARLGRQITLDYQGKTVILATILKGSLYFAIDLLRAIQGPVMLDFMAISSYGRSTHSSGVVRIQKDLEEHLEGRHCIIVEDIVDTGLTLDYLLRTLSGRRPASLKVCTLLDKPTRRIKEVPIHYRGFEIDDRFVVGYGLDYLDYYRHLPFICTMK